MTPFLLNSCDRPNKMYKQMLKGTSNAYTLYHNKLTTLLHSAKLYYYSKFFETYQQNSFEAWKMINNLSERNFKMPVAWIILIIILILLINVLLPYR